jgi:hypothetical protein
MAFPASPPSLAMVTLTSAVRAVRAWPVESQQKARRNAMLACTSLTQRRLERQDVADFLASLHAPADISADISAAPPGAVAHG